MELKIKMNVIKSTFFFVILFFMLIQNSSAQKAFQKKVFRSANNDSLLYNILYPKSFLYKESKFEKYPLVIFLHGSGERGSDNETQIMHIKNLFLNKASQKKHPAFVIAPQCPKDERWVDVKWDQEKHFMPQSPSKSMQLTIELINSLVEKFPIDTNRIYITGLSMGGFGTWDVIARYPDKFAAAIPICGGGDENIAELIKNIPIWAFHGTNDKVVKVSRSRNMINAIKNEGGTPKYTEYKGVGHGSWIKAYKETELLEWLFRQEKKYK